jgi:amino acid adenylation domain-containing protein
MHHMVCDGPSLHLLFDELAALYNSAGADSGPRELPRLTVQYADYATAQQEREPADDEVEWWRGYLSGARVRLALPVDRPHPAVRDTAGATHVVRLPKALMDQVGELARTTRTSPFMLMLGVYGALLGRLCGTEDLLVGTPVSGRSTPELEPVIGLFAHTLPIRIDLSGRPTLAEVVGRTRSSLFSVLAHQDMPFQTLVDRLRLDRDMRHTPLVQTVFTFEPRPMVQPRLAGLTARLLPVLPTSAKFDLDVMCVQSDDGSDDCEVWITYNTDVLDAATIHQFAELFQRLLQQSVDDPHVPLCSLALLSEEGRARVLGAGRSATAARPVDAHLDELFARTAAATPFAPAVAAGDRTVTYAELDARVDRLAGHLTARGVGLDDVVATLLPRGVDFVVTVLAILRVGAAYLPLDPVHPTGRLRRMITAANAWLVVSAGTNAERLSDPDVDILNVDDFGPLVGPEPTRSRSHPDGLAFVIFTSGSTGEPKGVAIPRRALVNHAQALSSRLGLTAADRVLQFTSVAFDVAAEEIFPTLLAGACVVICPDPTPPPTALTRVLADAAVTVANLPSSFWQQWAAGVEATDLPGQLRLLVIGSETVDPASVRAWSQKSTIPILNAYGLTEATVTSVVHRVQPLPAVGVVPVGTPVDGVEAYVLDEELEPVPVGVPAELHLAGEGLARGYLGRPDLTAERFLPNPFSDVPGARMYRTGDRARWRADGVLEVLGRIDGQLKVRGYRIEPGEVESALCRHPDIVQAAVVARPDADGALQLVGYVVPRDGRTVPADWRTRLSEQLPAYLTPTVLVGLDALPTTVGGKVARSALSDVATVPARTPSRTITPPRTVLQRQLHRIWHDVLAVDAVGIEDNFFDVGGNSFSLARVHARIVELLGQQLSLVALYEHPTISALADHLTRPAVPATPPAEPTRAHDRLLAGRARLARRRSQHV